MATTDLVYWVPHDEEVWLPGKHKGGNLYETPLGEVTVPDDKRGQEITDPVELEGVEDCCQLTNVSPASILHTTRARYLRGDIYTNVSNVLIAVNPFKAQTIYGQEYVERYRHIKDVAGHPPHVYAVCAGAFAGLLEMEDHRSQAVLISGESGAGKTETTKLVLFYTSEMLSGQEGGLEDTLMEINPILEAFGNAKTVRNNNSSRFGKWIEVCVDTASRSLQGVQVVDYLLEVTRVCGQGPRERNYHIFYQIAADPSTRATLKLEDAALSGYLCANPMSIEGVDDAEELLQLRKALTTLNFEKSEEASIFQVVAAIVHFGCLEFTGSSEAKVANPERLATVAELLEVDATALSKCMCFKRIATGRDVCMSPLDEAKARGARDAVAKMVYSLLFKWIVARCNQALGENLKNLPGDQGNGQFLGVLDIAGFESFEKNMLEQLLINLSNEKLQQFFNTTVFKQELEEYKAEDIDIRDINFADNADVLALIEGPSGVLSMLDDATTGVKQTDELFAQKLLKEKASDARLLKPKKFDPLLFGIRHYAGDVFYTAEAFLEKNASSQPPEVLELMRSSKMELLTELAKEPEAPADGGASPDRRGSVLGPKKKATVGSGFKKSLQQLMEKLRTANCHFIRCIKPNKEKAPHTFTSTMVMDQLRLCGVMETVEIRKAGFLVRQRYQEFVARYLMTVPKADRRQLAASAGTDPRAAAQTILRVAGAQAGESALGKTKVFVKSQLYQNLEASRRAAFEPFAVRIQAAWRGYWTRELMKEVREVHTQIIRLMEASGHGLRGLAPAQPKRADRATIVEGSLRQFDLVLTRATSLPIRPGYLQEATKVRARMNAEATLARKLANLALQLNVFDMEEALAQAAQCGMEGDLVDAVKRKLAELNVEAPLKQTLQAALDVDEFDELAKAVEVARSKGLEHPSKWAMPSGAAAIKQVLARLTELQEERDKAAAFQADLLREVEAHTSSVDLPAIQEVLARAAAGGVRGELVDRLAARCAVLDRQLEIRRELQACIASRDILDIEQVIRRAEDAGIRDADRWLLPNSGDELSQAEGRATQLRADQDAAARAAQGAGEKLVEELKAALQRSFDPERLKGLLERTEAHVQKARAAAGASEGAAAEEAGLAEQLRERIGVLEEEVVWRDKMKHFIAEVDSMDALRDEVVVPLREAKKDKESNWLLPDGFLLWKELKAKYDYVAEQRHILQVLDYSSKEYDVAKMEEVFARAQKFGVDESKYPEAMKIYNQLQKIFTVKDLLAKNPGYPMKQNLQKQLEELQAREGGDRSVIELQLKRCANSTSVDEMRAVLRKADRAEVKGQLADQLRSRCADLEREEPLFQAIHEALWKRDFDAAEQAIQAVKDAQGDKLSDPDSWVHPRLASTYQQAVASLDEFRKEKELKTDADREFPRRLESMLLSYDVVEMEEVLKEAKKRNFGGPVVTYVCERLAAIERQREALAAMRGCLASRDIHQVQEVVDKLHAGGLDDAENWVLEEGPKCVAIVNGLLKELEAAKASELGAETEIRNLLRELNNSTDIPAMKAALAKAAAHQVRSELIGKIADRVEALKAQQPYLKELRSVQHSESFDEIDEVIKRVKREKLDNPRSWAWPEGPKLFSRAVTRRLYCERADTLEIRLRDAGRIYDVRELQACFREAEEIGLPVERYAEAKRLVLSLQSGDTINELLMDLREKARSAEQTDTQTGLAIKNLYEQLLDLGLKTNNQALRDVSERMALQPRKRGKSCLDSEDADERELADAVFEDLANFKNLRDPMTWVDATSPDPEERARAMVRWQADKITMSLTLLHPRQEILALQNFLDLLRCMGDKPCAFQGDKEDPILRRLTVSRRLCDEIYMQVMKQLAGNPSSDSASRGWALLRKMVQEALPSAEVYEFLRCFVQREARPRTESWALRAAAEAGAGAAGAPAPAAPAPAAKEPSKKDLRRQLLQSAYRQLSNLKTQGEEGGAAEGGAPGGGTRSMNIAEVARAAVQQKQEEAMTASRSIGGTRARLQMRRQSRLAEAECRQEDFVVKKQSYQARQTALASEVLSLLMRES